MSCVAIDQVMQDSSSVEYVADHGGIYTKNGFIQKWADIFCCIILRCLDLSVEVTEVIEKTK